MPKRTMSAEEAATRMPPPPPGAGKPEEGGGGTGGDAAVDLPLKDRAIEAVRTCYDPEIPVNIYDLGLIYRLDVDEPSGRVDVDMTLTSPACPVAGTLPGEVQAKIRSVEGVSDCRMEVVWDPPWTPEKMTDAARLQLGMDM